MKKIKFPLILFTLLVAYILLNLPVFHDGLFHVYDNVHVTRLMAFSSELERGQFPVRYLDSFGWGAGYFLFTFYSPLIYYLGSFIHLLGFSFIKSIKLIYLLMTALGMGGSYLLLRSRFSRFASVLGTLAFAFSPYLYHDLFHRGTLTEAAAFLLLPFVFWATIKLRESDSPRYLAITALFLSATILSHALTGVMAIIASFLIYFLPPFRSPLRYLLSLSLSLSLSAFYLIPSLVYKDLVRYTDNSLVTRGYLDHPVPFFTQFFGSLNSPEKSAFLGLPLTIGFFIALFLFLRSPRYVSRYRFVASFSLITLAVCFFIMDPASGFLWSSLLSLRHVQFPFRFLSIAVVAGSILYASLIDHFQKSRLVALSLILLLVSPVFIYPLFYKPLGYQYTTDYRVEDPCQTTAWADEHLSLWTSKCLTATPDLIQTLTGDISPKNLVVNDNGRTLTFDFSGRGQVQIGKYYFPHWVAFDATDTQLPLVPYGDSGLIMLDLTGAVSPVTVKLEDTRAETIGNYLTLLSFALCLYIIGRSTKNHENIT